MCLDIVFVTYNSEKWIEQCFSSIANSVYDLKSISIVVVDNNSNDRTLELLYKAKEQYNNFYNNFNIIESKENLGFGKGNNLGFENCDSDYVLFLNIDTELDKRALNELILNIRKSEKEIALWELRQFPYEHPKMYNPVSGEISWSSGAAFAVKRQVFREIEGFDKNIFMYAEDVDLSWRIRCHGYKLKYVPKSVVHHYCYKEANEVKPNQYFNSIINNIMLRYKFGKLKDVVKGYAMFFNLMRTKGPFEHSRKLLIKKFIKQHVRIAPFIKWRILNKNKLKKFTPQFYGWDYEIAREGAFYFNEFPQNSIKVSVIVRTCGRPSILRETLISLRNQTYENIEVLVIEDGENISEKIIKDEFNDLNIIYKSTGKKVGRSKVGNIGLDLATGKYLNFLDDDDVFFADHIEVLVKQLEENESYRIAYSLAYETPIIVESKTPYIYKEIYHNLIYKQPFNRMLLFHHNYIPIQTIMFEKSVYLEEGGFDETIDFLEDWDLWVRYAVKNDFFYVNKITSMYRVPFDKQINEERQKQLDDSLENLRNKHKNYISEVNVSNISNELQMILDSYIIRISAEVFAKIESKQPFISKIIIKSKNFLKKFLR